MSKLIFNRKKKSKYDNEGSAISSASTLVTSSVIADLEGLSITKERLERYVDEAKDKTETELTNRARTARENAIRKTLSSIKRSMEVDLCFVLDCTGSMESHISAVKDCIVKVTDYVTSINPSIKIWVGFCGYRDFSDGSDRLIVSDFTDSYAMFKAYVATISAEGGDDAPEDVLGGLDAAVRQMNWRHGTRILLHIGDCPPHGRRYSSLEDSYPGGDPYGLTAESVLKHMELENILYFFGRITSLTDQMVEIFRSIIGDFPVFDLEECDAATMVDKFYKAASSAINSSVSLTSTIGSDARDIYTMRREKLEMNPDEPNWDRYRPQNGVVLWYRPPKTLDDLKNRKYFNKSNILYRNFIYMISTQPFSSGTEKYAYYGLDHKSRPSKKIVIKEYLKLGGGAEKYLEVAEVSIVAYYLAAKFNEAARRIKVKKVNFLEVKVLRSSVGGTTRYYAVEERLKDGEFKRFNVNSGVIVEFHPVLEAFAHFTYTHTNRYLVVYDLQGVEKANQFLLTDPAIHCIDSLRFGKTNLGEKGINECFLANHKCNDICRKLKLRR
ncbi:5002_t:CDS:1 [Paraglomus brasilianum]|uniref:5002_t:CDS:1 n=1 Tax=Paraglomus brasilianum TaxID=144538 RepID=A0A9N9DA94_9GLOM|nr:5002_t:CDS:1 [Paraglomus brasilianum]